MTYVAIIALGNMVLYVGIKKKSTILQILALIIFVMTIIALIMQ